MRRIACALVALLGCGDTDDAGTVTSGELRVRVIRSELPIAGANVVFHDQRGELLGSAVSDADGWASGPIASDGMVTVVDPQDAKRLTTVTRVAVDSTLEIPLEVELGVYDMPEVGTFTIAAPPGAPPAGTEGYSIHTPCGSDYVASLPATTKLRAGCEGDGVPVIVTAVGPMPSFEDLPPGLGYATALVSSGVAQLGAWSVQCKEVALDSSSPLSLFVQPRLAGRTFRYLETDFCPTPTLGQPTLDLGDGAVVSASGYVDGSAPAGEMRLVRDYATMPASVPIGSADLLGGVIEDGHVDAHGAAWRASDTLGDADFVMTTVEWLVAPVEFVVWRFVLPSEAVAASVPELPSELVSWDSLDTMFTILYVRYADASWIGTFAGVRAELSLLLDPWKSTLSPPSGGSIRDFTHTFN